MTWELATFSVSIGVLALQGLNLYISLGIKLWTTEHFVSKEEYYRRRPFHVMD